MTLQLEFETKEGQYQELSWFGNEEGKESVEVRGVASRSSVTDHSCCMCNPLRPDVSTLSMGKSNHYLISKQSFVGVQPGPLMYIFAYHNSKVQ